MFTKLRMFIAAVKNSEPPEAEWDDSADEALNLSFPDPDLGQDDTIEDGDG